MQVAEGYLYVITVERLHSSLTLMYIVLRPVETLHISLNMARLHSSLHMCRWTQVKSERQREKGSERKVQRERERE